MYIKKFCQTPITSTSTPDPERTPTPPVPKRTPTPPVPERTPTTPVPERTPTPPVPERTPTPPVPEHIPTPPGPERTSPEHTSPISKWEQHWVTVYGLRLSQLDREILANGQWLADTLIHAAQLLIKHDPDFLSFDSLQNPILSQKNAFKIITKQSVQILHSDSHWITIATTEDSSVRVYDSLYRKLPYKTCEQVACLLHSKEGEIALEFINVQVSKRCILIIILLSHFAYIKLLFSDLAILIILYLFSSCRNRRMAPIVVFLPLQMW